MKTRLSGKCFRIENETMSPGFAGSAVGSGEIGPPHAIPPYRRLDIGRDSHLESLSHCPSEFRYAADAAGIHSICFFLTLGQI